jgi:hypothetical protein
MTSLGKGSVHLEFWGDGQGHHVHLSDRDVEIDWDDISQALTIRFEYGSEYAAQELYWQLLEIIPQLRKDRR